ncbi:MAG: DUF4159 domain-containing protein [Candidatus Latescibacterota bacterium]
MVDTRPHDFRSVQRQARQRVVYALVGAAVLIHLAFILSKWVAYAIGIAGLALLLSALWKATTGRRLGMNVALLIAVLVHSGVFVYSYYFAEEEKQEEQRLVRFQAPPPILEKNFDLAKRPEISEVQMEMLAAMAPPDAPPDISAVADVSAVGSDLLGAVMPGPQSGGAFSGARAEELSFDDVEMIELAETAQPVQEALSLRHELLNVQDLDFGRYQAILIQDPENKRNIKGFFNMTVIDYDVADKNRDRFPTAVEELMRYMRDNTRINARIEGTTVELSDPRIMEAPFLYMTGWDATLTISPTEKKNLGEYLRNGGFLFAEDIRHATEGGGLEGLDAGVVGTPFDRQFKALMKDPLVLGGDGDKWEKMTAEHPLYYSFWEFPDGPPLGGAPGGNVFDLEMLQIRGRVAVVFSDLNISYYWGDPLADARERGLQFGVNLVVYALTQPGGIANVTQYAQ